VPDAGADVDGVAADRHRCSSELVDPLLEHHALAHRSDSHTATNSSPPKRATVSTSAQHA